MSSLNDVTPEKSAWGYKGLIVALLIATTFLGFFFLAVSSEPEYMPSQQKARQAELQKQQTEKQTIEKLDTTQTEEKLENVPTDVVEKTENKTIKTE